ncbi:MAG: DUF3857 domain-containing protein [Bacteroidetes bacterium]|nr:DUF3857 domain-containing protein [Bacteroidota bacterium]
MKKLFTLILCCAAAIGAKAQTPAIPAIESIGKVNQADLDLKKCDFEPDANAEVLFDKGTVYFSINPNDATVVLEERKRIKVFNDNGKSAANVRIEYYGNNHEEWIENIQAETINPNNGSLEIVKVDKKQIYTQRVDDDYWSVTFTFPDVKAGSILDFKYTRESKNIGALPFWYFQMGIPVRYSEYAATIYNGLFYKNLLHASQPTVKLERDPNSNQITDIALANVPSVNEEPYFTAIDDNVEYLFSQLSSVNIPGYVNTWSETWNRVGEDEAGFDNFGGQFRRKLNGEEDILTHAKGLKTNDEKIAYIFNAVKNNMKWNGIYSRVTDDGTSKAWDKKIGNSAELNLMVYHLLMRAGINALPIMLSTKKHGKVNPTFSNRYQFNTTAVYVPVDSTTNYVLDATNKYNLYNVIPENLLNSYGLTIDKENKKYDLVFIQNPSPVRNMVMITADIKPDGKMDGSAQVSSLSYNKIKEEENYNINGEKKYTDSLKKDNNDLTISSIKMENMGIDSLPLTRTINFSLDLTGSDGTYIYFKPNLFEPFGGNPFLAEKRTTDIDFRFLRNDVIMGSYKIPAGYKSDALPKSVKMDMSDQSISFKRLVSEQDGVIVVRYTVLYKQAIFFKENYDELHEFYKKMYELMNEQIVLKKA